MQAAFAGTLQSALRLAAGGTLAGTIARGFETAVATRPHADDLATWKEVLPLALRVSAHVLPPSTHVVVECPLPFNGQRMDLVLLGGSERGPAAYVLELKRWKQTGAS